MKITDSTLNFEVNHSKTTQQDVRQSLRAWVGDNRLAANSPAAPTAAVQLSDSGKAAQAGEASAIQDGVDAVENDPMLRLIRAMVALLTGREVKIFDARELQTEQPAPVVQASPPSSSNQASSAAAGFGIEYDRQTSYSESEQTQFAASGTVRTADGQEISVNLSLSMTRNYSEQSNASVSIGDARAQKDPLVLNFDGTAAQLSSQRFKFDLDSDGQSESINSLAGGSGFLALDRNADGKINNGSELFGAKSGDGFAELATLDSDQNGWIDENDAAFNRLLVWSKDAAGKDQLLTLKQANVGAISLAHVATPFDVKDQSNALQGQIRSSGIFLKDDGSAATVQQIDLTV